MSQKKFVPLSVILLTLFIGSAFAADGKPATQPGMTAPSTNGAKQPETLTPGMSESDEAGTLPERIDVQAMKRRYWTVGNEDLMDVVQNRLYTKKGRLELGLRYGFWSDDPFISANTMGASLGYHINEFLSIHGFYAKVDSSPSDAYKTAESRQPVGFTPVTNPAESVYGAEARGSLMYGKLSLLGESIIYYDFNVAAGAAKFNNKEGDSPIGFFAGLGQQVYLNKTLFVTVDYRLLFHTDKFGRSNTVMDTERSVTTSWIQVGLGAFFF